MLRSPLEPTEHRSPIAFFSVKHGDVVGRYRVSTAPTGLVAAHGFLLINFNALTNVEHITKANPAG
jgi:hypothetical protein